MVDTSLSYFAGGLPPVFYLFSLCKFVQVRAKDARTIASLNSKITSLNTLDAIGAASLFDVVDSSLVELHGSDCVIYKIGRLVFGSIRFVLKQNTTGSVKLCSVKTQALKSKWFPMQSSNYVVFPVFSTWNASNKALAFMNDSYDFGIGPAVADSYIGTFAYVARS